MDYVAWGAEYLEEAFKLKKRSDCLRKQLEARKGEDTIQLYGRYSMIREMYLECLRTGRDLQERGRRYAAKQKNFKP